jgi:hypothetical protein
MSKRTKPPQVVMYLATQVQLERWEIVKRNMGAGHSLSSILNYLVEEYVRCNINQEAATQ